MKAQDFAAVAMQTGETANRVKPPEDDKYATARHVIVYHLRTAARLSRELSERLAQEEKNAGQ